MARFLHPSLFALVLGVVLVFSGIRQAWNAFKAPGLQEISCSKARGLPLEVGMPVRLVGCVAELKFIQSAVETQERLRNLPGSSHAEKLGHVLLVPLNARGLAGAAPFAVELTGDDDIEELARHLEAPNEVPPPRSPRVLRVLASGATGIEGVVVPAPLRFGPADGFFDGRTVVVGARAAGQPAPTPTQGFVIAGVGAGFLLFALVRGLAGRSTRRTVLPGELDPDALFRQYQPQLGELERSRDEAKAADSRTKSDS